MHSRASLALALGIMAVSGYAVIAAWFWPWKAALFPLVIGIPIFVLSAAEAAWVLFGKTERGEVQDFQLARDVPEREVARRSVAAAEIVPVVRRVTLDAVDTNAPRRKLVLAHVDDGDGQVVDVDLDSTVRVGATTRSRCTRAAGRRSSSCPSRPS